ncbi:MAG: hypothetical protein CME65_09400 [Halobacteriovoraceae bacterium]|nr:hypothetical protein [Halobacteriovoraceae bacterium]
MVTAIVEKNSITLDPEFSEILKDSALKISQTKNREALLKICQFCLERGEPEPVYLIGGNQVHWSYELQSLYLEALWQLGQVKEFEEELKEVCKTILIKKYLSKALGLITLFDNRAREKKFWNKFKILFYAETNDYDSLKGLTKNLESYESFYEILSILDISEPNLSFTILKQKIKENHRYEVMPNEIIEYILLAIDNIERLRVYEIDYLEENIRNILFNIAQDKLKLKHVSVPSDMPKLKKALRPDFKIEKRTIQKSEINFPKLYEIHGQAEERDFEQLQYELSPEEKDIITRLAFEKHDKSEYSELVKSMISINFYTAALKIVEKMEFSEEKLYYQGYLHLKIGNYGESIYFINEYLNRVEPEDKEPFLKMKRQAHQGLKHNFVEENDS